MKDLISGNADLLAVAVLIFTLGLFQVPQIEIRTRRAVWDAAHSAPVYAPKVPRIVRIWQ